MAKQKQPKRSRCLIQLESRKKAYIDWTDDGASTTKPSVTVFAAIVHALNNDEILIVVYPDDEYGRDEMTRVDVAPTPIRVETARQFASAMFALKGRYGYRILGFEPESYFYVDDD